MKNLKEKVISGLAWNVSANIINQILTIGTAIFLSRILEPEDFGLLGMIIVFTSFAELFSQLGFGAALIQQREVSANTYTSVFWLNIFLGIFFTLLFTVMAPLISIFYEEPRLQKVTIVISLSFIINAFGSIHQNILDKKLAFKKIGIISLTSVFLSNLIAIIMAINGYGVWSLIVKLLSGSTIKTLLLWNITQWRPKFYFEKKLIQNLLGFSLNVTGIKTLRYWAKKVDILVIGKVLGAYSLGLYSRAYFFLFFPINLIKKQVLSVLYPSLSSIQEDPVRIKKMVLKISAVLAFSGYPLIIGLYVTASEVVEILLGSKWIEIIPLIKILCLAALIQIPTFPGTIYLAMGRADRQFKIDLISKSIWILSVVFGIMKGGLIGATLGVLLGICFNIIINNYYAGKLINLSLKEILLNLVPGILTAFLLFIFLQSLSQLIIYLDIPKLMSLIVKIVLGGSFYFLLIFAFKPYPIKELEQLIIEIYQKK